MNFNLVEMYNGLLRFNKHILNMIGVFILKIEKKILNLKYNILWLKINLKMILLELYAV